MNARSWLQILLLSAVWGVSFLMIRIAGAVFPPFWVALLRCTLGAALMWAVLLLGGNKLPPRHLLPWLLAVAFFNNEKTKGTKISVAKVATNKPPITALPKGEVR